MEVKHHEWPLLSGWVCSLRPQTCVGVKAFYSRVDLFLFQCIFPVHSEIPLNAPKTGNTEMEGMTGSTVGAHNVLVTRLSPLSTTNKLLIRHSL